MTTPTGQVDSPSAAVPLAVCADPPNDNALLATARRLASELDLPLTTAADPTPARAVLLAVVPGRLELRLPDDPGRPVWIDLTKLDTSSPAGRSRRQPLIRALGLKRAAHPAPTVIDATAGWGEDSWLMAARGCRVLAVERHGVVLAMLRDALARAATTKPAVAQRITPLAADAADLLRRLAAPGDTHELPPPAAPWSAPDIVYLDPMYPTRGRKTAERKPLKLLRQLAGDDPDAADLLAAAQRVARRRVVVKRPLHAPPLGGIPHHAHRGKALRYDVYLCCTKPERGGNA